MRFCINNNFKENHKFMHGSCALTVKLGKPWTPEKFQECWLCTKFRIRKQTSKPQTNYCCCLRFSYLAPYWLISRNTIIFHKYFWCSWFLCLSPNIHIQILCTNTHTFPNRFSWENLIKDQSSFLKVIIFLILITFAIDNQRILLGENWGWLLLRLTFRLPSNSDGQIFQPVGYLNIDCLN